MATVNLPEYLNEFDKSHPFHDEQAITALYNIIFTIVISSVNFTACDHL